MIFLDELIGVGVRATVMPKVGEYEENAAACRRLAAQTKNPTLKKHHCFDPDQYRLEVLYLADVS